MPNGIMWDGYGDDELDSDGSVFKRLEAIWQALARDYQLAYISTMVTYAPGETQRIH